MGKMFSKSSSLNLLCLLGLNVGGMVLRWPPFRIVSDGPTAKAADISRHNFNIGPYGKNVFKIFLSVTAKPIMTKLGWNDPKVVSFQNYVR